MAKPHPRADLQQSLRLGSHRGRGRNPKSLGRAPDEHRVARRLGRRDQHQRTHITGKCLEPAAKALLDPRGHRLCFEQSEPARQLGRGQPARQLEQRQRIPPRLGQDAIPHGLIQRKANDRPQQRASILIRQALNLELWQSPKVPPGSRATNISPTGSARSRRATNASTCADARSNHCASSTTQRSGCSSAASASKVTTANPTKKRGRRSRSCYFRCGRSCRYP